MVWSRSPSSPSAESTEPTGSSGSDLTGTAGERIGLAMALSRVRSFTVVEQVPDCIYVDLPASFTFDLAEDEAEAVLARLRQRGFCASRFLPDPVSDGFRCRLCIGIRVAVFEQVAWTAPDTRAVGVATSASDADGAVGVDLAGGGAAVPIDPPHRRVLQGSRDLPASYVAMAGVLRQSWSELTTADPASSTIQIVTALPTIRIVAALEWIWAAMMPDQRSAAVATLRRDEGTWAFLTTGEP